MWQSYSAKSAAQLIGMPESAVRTLVRAGIVGSSTEPPIQLSFRDLSALRAVKALLGQGLSLRRARAELVALRARIGAEQALAELPLEVRGGHVVVRGETVHSGQLELPWAMPSAPVAEAPLIALPVADLSRATLALPTSADDWFARAQRLEDTEPEAAIECYQRGLRLRPDAGEAWVNLGRLHAERGEAHAAHECFTAAIDLDPADATALYNLGVVAQDRGRDREAIDLYQRALEIDARLAEAHYNLATLFDQTGEAQQAIRHLNEYRKLTR